MTFLSHRIIQRTVLVAFLCAVVTYAVWSALSYMRHRQPIGSKPALPPAGLAENETYGKVPGDPKNGVRVLQEIYHLHVKYQALHGGEHCKDFLALLGEARANPKAYGFSDVYALNAALSNPDNQLADDKSLRASSSSLSDTSNTMRADGTPFLGPKSPGTRDVIAAMETYLHKNQRDFPNERTTLNPTGFYQVLWDDGSVENIPYDKVLYAYLHDASGVRTKSFLITFPGQAGVPADAMDYDTYWREKMHWSIPPHGTADGKGTSYNGQSYR